MCRVNYGVSFTMIAPTPVTGDNANPLFNMIRSPGRRAGMELLQVRPKSGRGADGQLPQPGCALRRGTGRCC
nr:hypothetical protein [Halospina sp. K52047b]